MSKSEISQILLNILTDFHSQKLSKGDTISLYLLALNPLWPETHWLQIKPKPLMDTSNLDTKIIVADIGNYIPMKLSSKIDINWTLGEVISHSEFKKETRYSSLGLNLIFRKPQLIEVFEAIPSPMDILKLQTEGKRCVSLLTQIEYLDFEFDHHRNLRDFVIHDLEHFWKLAGDEALYREQINFYNQFLSALNSGELDFILHSEEFKEEMEYLMSDMNTHPAHALATLESLVLRGLPDSEDNCSNLWNNLKSYFNTNSQILQT